MVGHAALDRGIGVRIPASQPPHLTIQAPHFRICSLRVSALAGIRTPGEGYGEGLCPPRRHSSHRGSLAILESLPPSHTSDSPSISAPNHPCPSLQPTNGGNQYCVPRTTAGLRESEVCNDRRSFRGRDVPSKDGSRSSAATGTCRRDCRPERLRGVAPCAAGGEGISILQ